MNSTKGHDKSCVMSCHVMSCSSGPRFQFLITRPHLLSFYHAYVAQRLLMIQTLPAKMATSIWDPRIVGVGFNWVVTCKWLEDIPNIKIPVDFTFEVLVGFTFEVLMRRIYWFLKYMKIKILKKITFLTLFY